MLMIDEIIWSSLNRCPTCSWLQESTLEFHWIQGNTYTTFLERCVYVLVLGFNLDFYQCMYYSVPIILLFLEI